MHEPAEQAYFNQAVAPLLGGDAEYVGEVGGRDKLDLLAGASCLLNPLSWPEPFGMVMIEALACGTPVLATPCGSVPELITDGVTGFVRATESEMADTVLRVAELDRSRCRKEAAERFSTERMVADHIALYEQVSALGPALCVRKRPRAKSGRRGAQRAARLLRASGRSGLSLDRGAPARLAVR